MQRGDVLRRAEPHFAFEVPLTEARDDLVIHAEQPSRLRQQGGAFEGQADGLAGPVDERRAKLAFQAPDLQAYGRLRPRQQRRGPGEAGGLHHGDEGAQQLQVEVHQTVRHFITIRYVGHD
jgi:hypothetical protein